MLTDREKEILNCVIDGWDESDGQRMVGHVSYGEVFELFDKLGLKRPERLTAFIEKMERDEHSEK